MNQDNLIIVCLFMDELLITGNNGYEIGNLKFNMSIEVHMADV